MSFQVKEKMYRYLSTIKSAKNLSDKTIIAYKSDIIDFIAFVGDQYINEQTMLTYVQYLQQTRQLQSSTITRKIVSLKMFMEYLYQQKYIDRNYYCKFKLRKEKKLPKVLEIIDIKRLLHHATMQYNEATNGYKLWTTSRNLALIDILISTGIRIAEASDISLSDIIESERTILIHGKGKKQRLIYISSPETWRNLKQWLRLRETRTILTDKLFVNRSGSQLGIHGIEYIYNSLKKSAGVNGKSTPHYLRHTFATNLLSNGADLRSVQELLGHSSVSTTEIYTEVTVKRKKQVLKKFNYRNKI